MTIYSNLIVYLKAKDLTKKIYLATRGFPSHEIHGIVSQIRRAIVSVPLNIAEGSARGTDKQFKNFINIAIGSITEVKVCLELSFELGYLDLSTFEGFTKDSEEVSKLLYSLKKSIH